MEDVAHEVLSLVANSSVLSDVAARFVSSSVVEGAGAVFRQIFKNDFISAGVVLGIVGSLYAFLRWIIAIIYEYLVSSFSVSLIVSDTDEAFSWIKLYITRFYAAQAKDTRMAKKSRHFTVQASWPTHARQDEEGSMLLRFLLFDAVRCAYNRRFQTISRKSP
jgi:hypothetical protein